MDHAPFDRRTFLKTSLALVNSSAFAFSSGAPSDTDGNALLTSEFPFRHTPVPAQPCPYSDRLLIVALEGSADLVLGELVGMLDRGELPVEEVAGHWNFQIDFLDEHSIQCSLSAPVIGKRGGNRLSASSHMLVIVGDCIDGHLLGNEEIPELRRYCATLGSQFAAVVTAAKIRLNAILIRNSACKSLPVADDFIRRVAEEAFLDGPPIEIDATAFSATSRHKKTECLAADLWERIMPLADRVARLSTSDLSASGTNGQMCRAKCSDWQHTCDVIFAPTQNSLVRGN